MVSKEYYNKLTNTDSLKLKVFNSQPCLVSIFPYRNFLSIYLGIIKIYPAYNKELKEQKINRTYSFEIYDKDKITYIMPVEDSNVR